MKVWYLDSNNKVEYLRENHTDDDVMYSGGLPAGISTDTLDYDNDVYIGINDDGKEYTYDNGSKTFTEINKILPAVVEDLDNSSNWVSGITYHVFNDDGTGAYRQSITITNLVTDPGTEVYLNVRNIDKGWNYVLKCVKGGGGSGEDDDYDWTGSDLILHFRIDNVNAIGKYEIDFLGENDINHETINILFSFWAVNNADNWVHRFVPSSGTQNGTNKNFDFDYSSMGLLSIHEPLTAKEGSIELFINSMPMHNPDDYTEAADLQGIEMTAEATAPISNDKIWFKFVRSGATVDSPPKINGGTIWSKPGFGINIFEPGDIKVKFP